MGAYSKGGDIRGEGLFQSLTFSLRVEQKHTIHFPRKYIYQSTSISSQSSLSIVSSAGAADSMSSASGVKGLSFRRGGGLFEGGSLIEDLR